MDPLRRRRGTPAPTPFPLLSSAPREEVKNFTMSLTLWFFLVLPTFARRRGPDPLAVVLPLRRAAGLRYGHWWITQVALATPDLKPPRNKLQSTFCGEVRHATTALLAAAPRVRINPHRSIKDQRPRLDLAYLLVQIRSIEIRRSRCGLTACVPVSCRGFAKDTPIFPRFKPSSGQFKRN